MSALPCAIYTRKSSEEGLDQSFNSLHAQREACEAFILSQKSQGWRALPMAYDDGGLSGGNLQRPALTRLLKDVAESRVRIVVVYKVDRLTRSLADFAKLVELFDAHGVSFVSVTQQFNTTTSMGRLTLNVLLSFAQFEREVTGERIRDKIAASKRKGLWMGGVAPIGYRRPHERTLVIDEPQAARVREMYRMYLEQGCVRGLKLHVDRLGWTTPERRTRRADAVGNRPFSRGHLYRILGNAIYAGQISHRDKVYPGGHAAIVDPSTWQAVQKRLATNRQGERTRSAAASPSLLAGLAYDEHGGRLTPSHAKKQARRYRYYIGRAAAAGDQDAASLLRIPAQELEDAVTQALVGFLSDETRVLACLGPGDASAARRALQTAKRLAQSISAEGANTATRIEALQRLIGRVIVSGAHVQVSLRLHAVDDRAGHAD